MVERAVQDPAAVAPSVRRLVLARRLVQLREQAGLSRAEAAGRADIHVSYLGRLEKGERRLIPRTLRTLLRLYGVNEAAHAGWVEEATEAERPRWYADFHEALPQWFASYLALESEADFIWGYEPQFVPGLLQTRDYARAQLRMGAPTESDELLERRVELRVQRRRHLFERAVADRPRLWMIVDEAALRTPVGTPRVMSEQLAHLREMAQQPHVSLRVLPFACPRLTGAYSFLRFRQPEIPDNVLIEGLSFGLCLDDPADTEAYHATHARMAAAAWRAVPDHGIPAWLEHLGKELYP